MRYDPSGHPWLMKYLKITSYYIASFIDRYNLHWIKTLGIMIRFHSDLNTEITALALMISNTFCGCISWILAALQLIVPSTLLTRWGRVTHRRVSRVDHYWSAPSHYLNQCWNISIGPLAANFTEILIKIRAFSFKKMHLKTSPGKCRPFCLGLSVLITIPPSLHQLIFVPYVQNDISVSLLVARSRFSSKSHDFLLYGNRAALNNIFQ